MPKPTLIIPISCAKRGVDLGFTEADAGALFTQHIRDMLLRHAIKELAK